jgi:hypothetical protein
MKTQFLRPVGPLAAAGLIGVTMLSGGIFDATDRDDDTFAKRDDGVAELVLVDDDDDDEDESDDGTGMTSPSATDSTASSVAGGVGADHSVWDIPT